MTGQTVVCGMWYVQRTHNISLIIILFKEHDIAIFHLIFILFTTFGYRECIIEITLFL